jgi:hypothetical protein
MDLHPAAIVRQEASLRQLGQRAKNQQNWLREHGFKGLEGSIAFGQTLTEAKKTCGHGGFMTWMEEHGIHRKTGERAMKHYQERAKMDKLSNLDDIIIDATPCRTKEVEKNDEVVTVDETTQDDREDALPEGQSKPKPEPKPRQSTPRQQAQPPYKAAFSSWVSWLEQLAASSGSKAASGGLDKDEGFQRAMKALQAAWDASVAYLDWLDEQRHHQEREMFS